jgi:hypothetical protein
VGSEAYVQRLPLAKSLCEHMELRDLPSASHGELHTPPADFLNSELGDSLLLKLIYAQAVDCILSEDEEKNAEMTLWLLTALFVEARLTADPTLTMRVSGNIQSEGQAVKHIYKQVPCKCLRSLLKTKFKQELKLGFCMKCQKEEDDGSKLKRCSKCKAITYCSPECQRSDWSDHKKVCKLTSAYYAKSADPDVSSKKDGETRLDARLAKLREEENQREKTRRELYWAIGVDPDELDATPEGFIKTVYMQQLKPQLEQAANLTANRRQLIAQREQGLAGVRKCYEPLPEESKALMEEAFHLLSINADTDYANYDDPAKAVARVKEILSSGAVGVSPNLLSVKDGESLLVRVVSNYRLEEEEEGMQYQLELVKFLLEAGADPNLENVMDRQTALDNMDCNIEYSELSDGQNEIIKLLKEAGAKILPRNEMMTIIGERGMGLGFHEQAMQQSN